MPKSGFGHPPNPEQKPQDPCLACRKKAAVLGALTPASLFWVLDLPYNRRQQRKQEAKRPQAKPRRPQAKRLGEQKENVPHPLPAKGRSRAVG